MAVTVAEMLKMSQQQLDDLFTQSPVGEIPSGEFCVAGESVRSGQGRFAKQDSALRTERDHRQGL